MFFRIAFSNLWRNKRRTVITELSIVFGMVVIIFTGSLTNGLSRMWAIGMIESSVGAMQIEHIDYEKKRKFKPLETTLSDSNALIEAVERFPGVTNATGQLQITGLISNGSKSTRFVGMGIEVERRQAALPRMTEMIHDGRLIEPGKNEIMLGKSVAKNLGLDLGQSIMVLVRTINGGLNMVEFIYVASLWRADMPDVVSAHYAEMELSSAQKLLQMPDRVSQIVVAYDDFYAVPESAPLLEKKLNADGAWPVVVKDYSKLILGFEITKFFNLIGVIVGLVLFIIVGAGIANSMFMSVLERRKEIGTMKAIGAEQWTIKRLFITEGLTIAVLGVLLGLISGSLLVWEIGEIGGMPLPPSPGTSAGLVVTPILNYSSCGFGIGVALITALIASYIPALVSSKLDPVETLREE